MTRVLIISAAAVAVLIATSAAVAAILGGGGSGPIDAAPAPVGKVVAIFPSEREPATTPRRVPRRLFVSGLTVETAAKPACDRYRGVRRTWAERAELIHQSSLGAGTSKRAAVRYYASVTWLSQDEAGDFEEAIARISRSRLSYATGGLVKRGRLVAPFTREALAVCDLSAAYARTLTKLGRLDKRVSRIIGLARFKAAGLTDGVAQ